METMSIELYENQRKALLEMHNGCILCGDVGSGKTITSLAYFHCMEGGGKLKPKFEPMQVVKDLYVITTAKKRDLFDWQMEMTPFLFGSEDIYPDQKVVVDSWNNIGKYVDVKDSFFIFDEQRLVGSGAWVKAFLKIVKANRWILLSATPGDSWMDYVPVFIANGFFKNRTDFNNQHVVFKRFSKWPDVDKYINDRKLYRLKSRLLVEMHCDRKTVRHNEVVICVYDREKYKEVMKNRWNPFKDEPIANAAGLCYVLRRVVNSDSSRLEELEKLLEEHKRSIIFYNFDYELEAIKEKLAGGDIEIAEYNGHKHQEIPVNCPKWVYLVQYTAGCEGWNCVKTDTIIFYSQNYSYKVVEQASGRIDRLNTPFIDLYYYHLKSSAPIDLAISRALKNKKQFNESRFVRNLG